MFPDYCYGEERYNDICYQLAETCILSNFAYLRDKVFPNPYLPIQLTLKYGSGYDFIHLSADDIWNEKSFQGYHIDLEDCMKHEFSEKALDDAYELLYALYKDYLEALKAKEEAKDLFEDEH